MKAKPLITYIIPLILCLLAPAAAIAQVQIHGKVSDMENSPMEFVTVRVAGTAIGTTTGLDGSYKLSGAGQRHHNRGFLMHRLRRTAAPANQP